MLDYKEFKNEMLPRLKRALDEEHMEVAEASIPKVNRKVEALVVKEKKKETGESIGQIHDLAKLYEYYQNGAGVQELLALILHSLEQKKAKQEKLQILLCFEDCKDRILAQVIDKESNAEFLEGAVYRQILDLALVYRVELGIDEKEAVSAVITENLLEHWGISEEVLYQTAWENARNTAPYKVQNLLEIVSGIKEHTEPAAGEPKQNKNEFRVYVLSREEGHYGASAIAYPQAMQQVFAVFGEDFFLLPSSQQELIAVPFDKMEIENLKAIVRKVNHTEVFAEDWLSDSVYYYDHEAGEVKLAA